MANAAGVLRQTTRRLLQAPRFTIIAVVTLAAAVGANAAMFGVLNGVVLKPLPYPASDRLVGVWHTAPGLNIKDLNMSASNYLVYREQSTTMDDLGLYNGAQVSVTGTAEPEQLPGLSVTDGVLTALGVVPAAGRLFTSQDGVPHGPETIIISHALWSRKFGANPSAIGQTLVVDGTPRQIVGVLPRDFHFLDEPDPDVVLPIAFDRGDVKLGQFNYQGLARLKPGMTVADANADVARMLPTVLRAFPAPEGFSIKLFEDVHIGPNVRPLKQDVIGDVGGLLAVLMGCMGIVVLIACANVANLWLVRLEARRRELGLRAALGAGRGRIARELLLEAVVIGAASGVLATGIAAAALRAFVAAEPIGIPRLSAIHFDVTTALFTAAAALASALLFAALPILKYTAARPNMGMRDAGRTLTQSRSQHRVRNGLVIGQVALALVLLIGSVLMIRTFIAMSRVNPGFSDPATLQKFRISIPESLTKDPERVIQAQTDIREKLRAIPGVTDVAVASGVPLDGNHWMDPVFAQDRTYREGELAKLRRFKFVAPGYFDVIGTPLIAGRDLTEREVQQRIPVAIISREFAVEYWGSVQRAIGQRIRVASTDDWREIIGVAEDVYDDGVSQGPVSMVYWPMIQNKFESQPVMLRRSAAFILRTPRAGTDALERDMRQAVWSVNANLPLFSVGTLQTLYRRSMARTSLMLALLGSAGAMALLLGVVGLYGVIAYSVSQRTREIGIRLALGAGARQVTRMFVREGVLLAAAGIVAGIAGSLVAGRAMSSMLFRIHAADPVTYVLVAIGLIAVCLVATYLPSRRAAAVDPAIALRGE